MPSCCDVPIDHIPYIWPKIEPFVFKTLAKDPGHRFSAGDIFELLLSNRAHRLWVAWNSGTQEFDGFVITEVMQWPRAREFRMWTIGGRNLPQWRDEMRELIEGYARSEKCDYVAIYGRKAFARMPGYRQTSHVALFKDL